MRPVFMEPLGITRPITPPPAPPSTPVPTCSICKESASEFTCGICKDCYEELEALDRGDYMMSHPESFWEDYDASYGFEDDQDYEYYSIPNGCPDCGGYHDCYCR